MILTLINVLISWTFAYRISKIITKLMIDTKSYYNDWKQTASTREAFCVRLGFQRSLQYCVVRLKY